MVLSCMTSTLFVACMLFAQSDSEIAPGTAHNQVRLSMTRSSRRPDVLSISLRNESDREMRFIPAYVMNGRARWNISVMITSRDGRNVEAIQLPAVVITTGKVSPLIISVAGKSEYRKEFALREFAIFGAGGQTSLSTLAGSGAKLFISLHCGSYLSDSIRMTSDLWQGDLDSGTLQL